MAALPPHKRICVLVREEAAGWYREGLAVGTAETLIKQELLANGYPVVNEAMVEKVKRDKRAKLLEVDAPLALEQGADSSQASASSTSEEAIGGEILALVIKANAAGVDPDRALRLATERLARALIDSERSGE